MKKRIKKNWQLTLMILPAIIYFFIFSYIPMFGVCVAFERYNFRDGFFSPFVGLKNFEFLFKSGDAWRLLRNTMFYNFLFVAVSLVVQLVFAIGLTEFVSRKFQRLAQTCMLLPYFVSWVVVGAIAYNVFGYEHGILNNVLNSLGFESVNVYMEKDWWPAILTFFHTWKGAGYGTIVYVAAILGIDPELYDAAKIDGASAWQRVLHIILPLLKPSVITLLLLNLSHIARGDFNMFYNLIGNNSLLYPTTDIMETYIYRALMETGDVSMGAAAGLYQSVVCFVFIMTINTIIKKIDADYALF